MNITIRLIIILAVVGAAAATFIAREKRQPRPTEAVATNLASVATTKLPRLVDLGADKCIPCKKMAPILEELRTTCAGAFEVVFIDVWKNPDAAKPFNIDLIPTQIFFDAEGKELFRHEGFFAKEDILAKWRELGVTLPESGATETKPSHERTKP